MHIVLEVELFGGVERTLYEDEFCIGILYKVIDSGISQSFVYLYFLEKPALPGCYSFVYCHVFVDLIESIHSCEYTHFGIIVSVTLHATKDVNYALYDCHLVLKIFKFEFHKIGLCDFAGFDFGFKELEDIDGSLIVEAAFGVVELGEGG